MFGQTSELHDLILIAFLTLLEGFLSIQNALVLACSPVGCRKNCGPGALLWIYSAPVFRFLAIVAAGFLLAWRCAENGRRAVFGFIVLKHFHLAG